MPQKGQYYLTIEAEILPYGLSWFMI